MMNEIAVIILQSTEVEKNAKTKNSINLLSDYNLKTYWVESFSDVLKYNFSEDFLIFIYSGDLLAKSYIDKLKKINSAINYIYQPEYSSIFSRRGRSFFRKNIDITPGVEEINALLLEPHYSRHFAITLNLFQVFLKNSKISLDEVTYKFHDTLLTYLLSIGNYLVAIKDSISFELYLGGNYLDNKEEIYLNYFPVKSNLFDKHELLTVQNYLDVLGVES